MGTKRAEFIPLTPGPGDYESQLKEDKGFKIGQKRGEKAMEDLPAPGQYEMNSTLEQKGPSIGVKRDGKIL